MMRKVVLLLLASTVAAGVMYSQSALDDEVLNLPDAPAVDFKMFAGYVTFGFIRKSIFYWYVEAETNPETAPLVLWTNGGPGCSGLAGFMTEQGPFRPKVNGSGLERNPYAWNKIANMVFIEQPAGVGFSTVEDGGMQYSDGQAAFDNVLFITHFLQKFEHLKKNDFYLSSESYGGHYLPTLALNLAKQQHQGFKGFFLGNPLTYLQYRDFGQYGTFYGHQLLPRPLWLEYEKNDCMKNEASQACVDITSKMDSIVAGMDPYALDFAVCTNPSQAAKRSERYYTLNAIKNAHPDPDRIAMYMPEEKYEPCSANFATNYLNRPDVQKAIHAQNLTWGECNDEVNAKYNKTDVAAPMMPIYKELIDNYNLDILIYSGDDDSVCATMGSQQFIWDLGYNVTKEWHSWHVEKQVAGFAVEFDGFRFVTVHGSGHMVPSTQNERGYALFERFIKKEII